MNQEIKENKTFKYVSREEYEKRVEIAMAHYEYFDRLERDEAIAAAKKEVAQEYVKLVS